MSDFRPPKEKNKEAREAPLGREVVKEALEKQRAGEAGGLPFSWQRRSEHHLVEYT